METKVILSLAAVMLSWGVAFYLLSLHFFKQRPPEEVVMFFIGKGYAGSRKPDPERFAERTARFIRPLSVVIIVALLAMAAHFAVGVGSLLASALQHSGSDYFASTAVLILEFSFLLFGAFFLRVLERLRRVFRGYIWRMHPGVADRSTWTPSPLLR